MTTPTRRRERNPLAHPLRALIVAHLAKGPASPSEIAEALGETLGTTAYHVRALAADHIIRLERESRVRGAIEHHYALAAPMRAAEAAGELARIYTKTERKVRRSI